MTKDLKLQKLLECKANAYDSIVRLRRETDSHRRFHALCLNVFAGVQAFKRELELAPTIQSEQFSCMCKDLQCTACNGECKREASCQVELTPTLEQQMGVKERESLLMCDPCANSALHRGIANMVEESCSEIEQDFLPSANDPLAPLKKELL